ncbi:AAA domain-containing protein [Patescibacteria group bacterium]
MTTKDNLIKEFQQALQEEIEEIQKGGGESKIIGREVKFLGKKADSYIYQAIIDNPTELPDDSPIQVKTETESVKGNIINIEGLVLTFSLESDIGSRLTTITITSNPYYLLEIIKERLGESKSNYKLAQIAFGHSKPKIDEDNNFTSSINLETHQQKAVAKALGSNVSFIWGPPGTGKTYVLSAIAEELFNKGKSILIVSHTNIAIDNALERLAETLEKSNNKEYFDGKVIRYGVATIKDYFKKYPQLDIEHWIQIKGLELKVKKEELEKKLNVQQKIIEKLTNHVNTIEKITENNKLIKTIREDKEKLTQEQEKFESDNQNIKHELKKINKLIIDYPKISKIIKIIKGINLESLKKKQEQLEMDKSECKGKISNKKLEIEEKESQESQTNKTTKQQIDYLNKNSISESEYEKIKIEIEEKNVRLKSYQSEVAEINEKLGNLGSEILKQSRIIGTTLTKGYLKTEIYNRNFDIVIVDEASMATLPVLYFNFGLSQEKIIVIGDFRQLSPISRGKTELAEKWLKRDIYDQSGITQNINNNIEDDRITQLTLQYRMHPSISKIINKHIYNHKLRDAKKEGDSKKSEENTISSKPFANKPVTIVDVSDYDPWCATTPSWSRLNLYTADLASFLAIQAYNHGLTNIGIVAPFRAQINIIGKMVKESVSPDAINTISISSVHTTQGREKDLIIFDLTESTGSWVSKLLKGDAHSETMRLINVALSRAKSKLVIICNTKFIDKKYSEDSIIKKIIQDSTQDYSIVKSVDIIDYFPDSISKFDKPIILSNDAYDKKSALFTQANFYTAFFQDLKKSKKEVIIFSPFIYKNRFSDVDPSIRKLLNKDVSVIVFTTKPSGREKDKENIIDHLLKIGVKVIFKSGMHEKIAVIDRNISWYGSLNILSHQNTTESMMRFEGKELANEYLKQFKIDSSISNFSLQKKYDSIQYGQCPHCKEKLCVKNGKNGLFLACPSYPKCKFTSDLDENVIKIIFGDEYLICEKCGQKMVVRRSRWGKKFLACPGYPQCKFTRQL